MTVNSPVPNSGVKFREARMRPDWNTLTTVPYSKGHSRVMVKLYEESGDPSPLCPRHFLQRTLDEAAKEGIYIKVGIENEFSLLHPIKEDGIIRPLEDTFYSSTLAMDICCDVIADIVDTLIKQGVQIEVYHPEAANGQHELTLHYTDPLTAADQQIIVRETVKAVALKHNCLGSFVPVVVPNQGCNGTHLNFSLHTKDGTNIVPSDVKSNEISETTGHFIAGILEHIEAFMAVSCPTTNSMKRVYEQRLSGAYKMWGYDNRIAAIRIPYSNLQSSPNYFELKTSDSSGNPYFAIGAIIAAGMDGVKRRLPIPAPYNGDPKDLSKEELQRLNITTLPCDLEYIIDAFSKDKVLQDAFGPELGKCIVAVRKEEYKTMKDLSLEEECKLLLQKF